MTAFKPVRVVARFAIDQGAKRARLRGFRNDGVAILDPVKSILAPGTEFEISDEATFRALLKSNAIWPPEHIE